MRLIPGAIFSLLLAQTPAPSPSAPSMPATVSGRVIHSLTKEPVADAAIDLVRSPAGSPPAAALGISPAAFGRTGTPMPAPLRTRTAGDGRFALTNVPPGEYRLYATADNGFVPVEFGQRTATGLGTPITLAPGQDMSSITLSMNPTASVSGRVTDGDGDPSVFTSMLAFRIVYQPSGSRKIEVVQSVLTDDHGEYRLYWLAPGKYYVSAMPIETRSYGLPLSFANRFGGATYWATPMLGYRALDNGELVEETWSPIYYPGTTDILAAKAITLNAGEQFHADFNIAASPTRTLQVRGSLMDPAGKPLNASLILTPQKPEGHSVVLPVATSNEQGRFVIHGVVPGSYFLFVTGSAEPLPPGGLPPGENLLPFFNPPTAFEPLEIGKSGVDNLEIRTVPTINVSWRADFQTRAGGTASSINVKLVRDPDPAGAPAMAVGSQRTAQGALMTGIGAGYYRVSVTQLPKNTYVKSIRSAALDILKDGLQIHGETPQELSIVIADDGGTLDGHVLDDKRNPDPGAVVVLVPADPTVRPHRIDLLKTTSSDSDGKFHFDSIAPGDYKIFAWDDIRSGDWFDPGFMRVYEYRGVTALIGQSETKTLDVQAAPSETNRP